MKNVILGAGGFAREVAVILADLKHQVTGYTSDNPEQWNQKLTYADCLGTIESVQEIMIHFVPGIGSPGVRRQLVERALEKLWRPRTVISPHAHMPNVTCSDILRNSRGTVICAGVAATVDIKIGDYVNINLNCTLGHDCVIEDYVNLSPSVNVSGYVHIEEGADIGTGAVLLPGVRIGKGAIIGAGAVVNKNVPPGEVWVGVPAKPLKR